MRLRFLFLTSELLPITTSQCRCCSTHEGLKTMAQVQSYAKYIGLDLEAYPELVWIAEEGLRCPLPPSWVLVKPSEGDAHYFRNTETGVTSVDHPMDHHYRSLVSKEVHLIELSRRRVAANAAINPQESPKRSSRSGSTRSATSQAEIDRKRRTARGKKIRFFVYALVCLIAVHFIVTTHVFTRLTNGLTIEVTERTTTITTTEQWLRVQNRTVIVKTCGDGCGNGSVANDLQDVRSDQAVGAETLDQRSDEVAPPESPGPEAAPESSDVARPAAVAQVPAATTQDEEEESLFSLW